MSTPGAGISLHQLLRAVVEKGASDLHITTGSPPLLRIDGSVVPLKLPPLSGPESRSLCYSADFTATAGNSPAALGNRIGAGAIAAGRRDGSLEALRYVDASYVPMNAPLVLAQSGSTVHDPTFWQPLALGQISAHGLGPIPAKIQSFVGAQWGQVRPYARGTPIDPGRSRPTGDQTACRPQQGRGKPGS